MSSLRGWEPTNTDDSYADPYSCYNRPLSPASSESSLSEVDGCSRRSGGSSRRQHDPDWVPRPRNSFIIFRGEYAQLNCRQGRRIRRPPGSSTEPTLSKRAALAWSRMTKEEKEPFKIRAEEERNEHARKYPNYRFRPQRRPGGGVRKYMTRRCNDLAACSHYSPEATPEPSRPYTTSSSSISVAPRPASSDGYSSGFEFDNVPPTQPIHISSPIPDQPSLLGWSSPTETEPPLTPLTPDAPCNVEIINPFGYYAQADYSDPQESRLQYPPHMEAQWPPQMMQYQVPYHDKSFEMVAGQTASSMNYYNSVGQPLPNTFDAMSLVEANIPTAGATTNGELFGVF